MEQTGLQILPARAYSFPVAAIMLSRSSGQVHSVFNSSFNLLFGDRFIHVGPSGNGLAPYGVGLMTHDVQQLIRHIQNGQMVVWHKARQLLMLNNGFAIILDDAEAMDHRLQSGTCDPSLLKQHFHDVVTQLSKDNWQHGIGETDVERQLVIDYLQSSDISGDNDMNITMLTNLALLSQGEHPVEVRTVLDYWIGRGLGLTPSGDDLIIGLCAMLTAIGKLDESFRLELHAYLLEKGTKRTTPIGYEYLLYASERQFHTQMINMCHAVCHNGQTDVWTALEEMKQIGHTSGADSLIGLLLALKVVTTVSR